MLSFNLLYIHLNEYASVSISLNTLHTLSTSNNDLLSRAGRKTEEKKENLRGEKKKIVIFFPIFLEKKKKVWNPIYTRTLKEKKSLH
ncbi:MAG: hypothetical protein BVN35_17600 [Proteobacteria bacterium ST_bin11]|nr:MAG: hypothetical protein BVN35_17600 [Proteobacteria bacterium ST_bin11]